jgi:2-polyprenyl-6-methoxyphenol hydroxylase-like FAD-dependent oxidoreductase
VFSLSFPFAIMAAAVLPILIAGAGPVGLTLAIELTRRKIPMRIIEKEEERPPLSKAIGINPRTLELLEECGVTEHILADGIPLQQIHLSLNGYTKVGDFSGVKHRYNFMIALPQSETERLLEEALNRYGVQVERGTTLTGFTQTDQGVLARFRHKDGEQQVMGQLVCGTDGAKSLVREEARIAFQGRDDPQAWSIADFKTDASLSPALHLMLHKDGPMLVVPFTQGIFRVGSVMKDSLEQLPATIPVREVVFESEFKVSYRVAETFVRGRVLLAGDAAHVHSPVGARGMNLGIEDAWTLARVISRNGNLEKWGRERRRKAQWVVLQTKVVSSVLSGENGFTRLARWLLFRNFERLAPLFMRQMMDI